MVSLFNLPTCLSACFVYNPPQVAIAQFSDDARTEFQLSSHGNKEELLEAIQKIRYKGGNTKTGLNGAVLYLFTLKTVNFLSVCYVKFLNRAGQTYRAERNENSARRPAHESNNRRFRFPAVHKSTTTKVNIILISVRTATAASALRSVCEGVRRPGAHTGDGQ